MKGLNKSKVSCGVGNNFSFCSLEGRVTEIVHRAFWDSLQEQLNSDPPNYTHAVTLLQEVKTVSVFGNQSKSQKETQRFE